MDRRNPTQIQVDIGRTELRPKVATREDDSGFLVFLVIGSAGSSTLSLGLRSRDQALALRKAIDAVIDEFDETGSLLRRTR